MLVLITCYEGWGSARVYASTVQPVCKDADGERSTNQFIQSWIIYYSLVIRTRNPTRFLFSRQYSELYPTDILFVPTV